MGTLTIRSLSVEGRAAAGVSGLNTAGELADCVERLVVPRLRTAMDEVSRDDDGVYAIRVLRVEVAVGADWPADRVASAIAEAIRRAIVRALSAVGPVHAEHLGERAAHLATVLADVAAGAPHRWHHAGWGRIADGPRGEALARLLAEAGEDGPRALGRLGAARAAGVVAALPPAAAERVARAWRVVDDPAGRPTRSAAAAVAAGLAEPSDRATEPARRILLLARAAALAPTVALRDLADAVRAAISPAAARQAAAARAPEGLPSAEAPPPPGRERTVRPERAARPAAERHAAEAPSTGALLTPHGALFLLWRSALATEAVAVAAAVAGDPLAGALHLSRALTPEPHDPAGDEAIRLLLRIPPGWEEPAPRTGLDVAETLARIRAARWRDDVPALLYESGSTPGPTLLADASTGALVALWPDGPPDPDAFAAASAGRPVCLSSEEKARLAPAWPLLGEAGERVWTAPHAGTEILETPVAARPADDIAALLGRLGGDAAALSLAVLALEVHRDLARRLPGFARAGLRWLVDNVLPTSAAVTPTPGEGGDLLLVRLAPPPLALFLQMTGMGRAEYALPGNPPLAVRLSLDAPS